MRNHAPIVAALLPGLIEVRDADSGTVRMAIGGGFFQMLNNEAIILADSAEDAGAIDAARAREAEQRATSRLAGKMEPAAEMQRERAEAALKRARARLKVASGSSGR